ncbi:uncharacterized protein LOC124446076 isoform X2 [Xenia sp. Carnegie-2017]|uniref:uncharacterized protein LOC124446076 isoform X2 n=1 Tax=Xenia sp. Carnegie-2017 TaxID=2897299 RepID=UPI001F04DCC6|nr:uncharacterized protein LOC124446076 isoform X2 [Xenia sp. Carnegie-2017]
MLYCLICEFVDRFEVLTELQGFMMTSKNDGWFYYNASCTKISQCFYENQPTGCLNISCPFVHTKPRPLLTNPPGIPQIFQPRIPVIHNLFGNNLGNNPRAGLPRLQNPRYNRFPGQVDLRSGQMTNSSFHILQSNQFRPDNMDPATQSNFSLSQHNFYKVQNEAGKTEMNADNAERLNLGDGLLPAPLYPLPLPGLPPLKIDSNSRDQALKKKMLRVSAKNSYKRTVKKYEGIRNIKYNRHSKRREIRKQSSHEDSNVKKRRKGKKSKNEKGYSNQKHEEKHEGLSKSHQDSVNIKWENEKSGEEINQNSDSIDDSFVEVNLAFKVKSLEEILREKALKKLREHQKNNSDAGNNEERSNISTTCAQKEDPNSEDTKKSCVEISNNLNENVTFERNNDLDSGVKPVNILKTQSSDSRISHFPPLKPLVTRKIIVGKSSQNNEQTPDAMLVSGSENLNVRPLPPLRRLSKVSKDVNSRDMAMKRSLESRADDVEIVPIMKTQKIDKIVLNDDIDQSPEKFNLNEVDISSTNSTSNEFRSLNKEMTLPLLAKKRSRKVVVLNPRTKDAMDMLTTGVYTERDDSISLSKNDPFSLCKDIYDSDDKSHSERRSLLKSMTDAQMNDIQGRNRVIKKPDVSIVKPFGTIPMKLGQDNNETIIPLEKDKQKSDIDDSILNDQENGQVSLFQSTTGTKALGKHVMEDDKLKSTCQTEERAKMVVHNVEPKIAKNEPKRMIKLNRGPLKEHEKGKSYTSLNASGRAIKVIKIKKQSEKVNVKRVEILEAQNHTINANEVVKDETGNTSKAKNFIGCVTSKDSKHELKQGNKSSVEFDTSKSLCAKAYDVGWELEKKVGDVNERRIDMNDTVLSTVSCNALEDKESNSRVPSIPEILWKRQETRNSKPQNNSDGDFLDFDDIEDEGENYLEEVLAELPPDDAVVDDVDDEYDNNLLLEMEEILNS